MKKTKKLLCVLLALAIAACMSATALADESSEVVWLDVNLPAFDYYTYGNHGFFDDCFYIEELDLFSFTVSTYKDGKDVDSPYLIDHSTGKLVTDREYDFVYPFSDGLAKASRNSELFGYVDSTGKPVIPLAYSWATDFYNGTALVKDSSGYKVIDKSGKTVKTLEQGITVKSSAKPARFFVYTKDELPYAPGCLDVAGNIILPAEEDYDWIVPLNNELIAVTRYVERDESTPTKEYVDGVADGLTGYYELSFETTIYSGNTPVLTLPRGINVNGVISDNGNYIVEKEYIYDEEVDSEGRKIITLLQVGGILDKNGNVVVPIEHVAMRSVSDNVFEGTEKSDRAERYYIDLNGNRIDGLNKLKDLTSGGTISLRFNGGIADLVDNSGSIAQRIVDEKGNFLFEKGFFENGGHEGLVGLDVGLTGKYILLADGDHSGQFGYIKNPIYDEYMLSQKTDVDAVYKDAVSWALKNGYADAESATTFGANNPCPRWEVVSILWRAMGSPEPTVTSVPFTDVSADAPYYKAVCWAYENNIAKGNSATTFGPNDTVMRRDAMTFIYRGAKEPAVAASGSFNDVPAGEYYTAPVAWAASNGIANGTGNNNFSPAVPVTRAQMVTFLYRWATGNK